MSAQVISIRSLAMLSLMAIVCHRFESSARSEDTHRTSEPTVNIQRGFCFAPIDLEIRCATPGATIIYTTDGDEPSLATGTRKSAPVTLKITHTTLFRTAAFKEGLEPSAVVTHTYIFPASVVNQMPPPGASLKWIEEPPGDGRSYPTDFTVNAAVVDRTLPGYSFTDALLAIPTVSIVTPVDGLFGTSNGIYTHAMMRGTNWERRASMELIYPNGRTGFQIDAGLRMQGAVSRLSHATPKHPLRLTFRAKYGAAHLNFPLFPDSKAQRFDHLVLRACSTDAWPMANTVDFLWRNQDATYQRDQWMRDTQIATGHPSPQGVYVQLYLNGLYWGMYNLTERPDEAFAAAHFGGSKKDYDVIAEFNGELRAGNRLAWDQLLGLAKTVSANPAALTQMQGLNPDGTRNPNYAVLIDVDNFIDYMALHIYAPAVDWPNRNWWAARRRGPDSGGFRFFVWDQEVGLDRLDRIVTWATNKKFAEVDDRGTPAEIYDHLRRDPEFKLRFADRLQKHLFNGGALSVEASRERWGARAAEIDHAIVGESARWGDTWQEPAYTRQTDWLRMSNFMQITYWPANFVNAVQRFHSVGLFPDLAAPVICKTTSNGATGFQLSITHTNNTGTIYYTLDGSDPRLRSGATAPSALMYRQAISLSQSTRIQARVRDNENWSPLVDAQF